MVIDDVLTAMLNTASEDASLISHDDAMSIASPIQIPFKAAITGWVQFANEEMAAWKSIT